MFPILNGFFEEMISQTVTGARTGKNVVEDAQFLEDIGDLERAGQALPVQDVRRFSGYILSLEKNGPGRWFEFTADNIEQGCLSRSVGADDGMTFLLFDFEVNPGQDLQSRKVLVNILDMKIIAHDVTSSVAADWPPLLSFFPKSRCRMIHNDLGQAAGNEQEP